jgi:predicted lipid-binding transport protein (Tim44 family)
VKRFLVALIVFIVGAGLLPIDSEAASRLGGGRSLGAQRQAPVQRQATPPAQQQPAQPQQTGPSRWLAPLAGLAAGLGLGWLFAQGGLGALLGTVVLALAAGLVVMLLLRLLTRPRSESAPMRYSGAGNETAAAPPPPSRMQPDYRSPLVSGTPAGFDVEGFLAQAKRNFLALQDANDRGDVEALREVTNAQMFDALAAEVAARASLKQQIDVVSLHADLLDVVTEGPLHWASVRFHGTIRENPHDLPTEFEEIWHLQKPVDGSTGWLLAGIQQPA